jgi:hypothetical protein
MSPKPKSYATGLDEKSGGERVETLQDFSRHIRDSIDFLKRRLKGDYDPNEFCVSAIVWQQNSEWVLDRLLVGTAVDDDQFPDRGRIFTQRGEPKAFTRLDTLARQLRDEFPGFGSVVIRIANKPSPQLISGLNKKVGGVTKRRIK